MAIVTKVANHGVAWEESFGYSQAFQAGDTLYLSGQLAHDDQGNLIGEGDFPRQMEATFENIEKLLAKFGATRRQIVDDQVIVVNLRQHFNDVITGHKAYFGDHRPASTTVGVVELALPGQLIEIAVTVRLDLPK